MTNGVAGRSTTSSGVPSCSIDAVVHDRDAVGQFQRFLLIVGDEDARQVNVVVQPAQPAAQLLAHLRIERAERFVEEQHLRFDRERARERHALTLTAGQLGGAAIRHEVQLHELQQLPDAAADLRFIRPRPAGPDAQARTPRSRTRSCAGRARNAETRTRRADRARCARSRPPLRE